MPVRPVPGGSHDSREPPELRVLVVEDNDADADLVREAFARRCARIDHVVRVADALTHVAAHKPDVILLDLSLPDASGLEGLQALRQTVPDIPVVVLTGSSDNVLGLEALREGGEDYLLKSEINEHMVYWAVFYAIERHRSRIRERALAVEQAARTESERLSRAKDRFLAVLAHELRNPLAPMRFALQTLKRRDAGEAILGHACEAMERQVSQLARLVDDLVDVSRITNNKLTLRKEEAMVAGMVSAAVEAAMPAIREAGHKLHVTAPSPSVFMSADSARVTQVLTNLLNNAAKFTPPGGSIGIDAHVRNGEALITVRDNGAGFDPEAASQLFDLFHQEHGHQAGSGLGVGLALSRQLVELHGGTISATSFGRGLGSEFVVRLPLVMESGKIPQSGETRLSAASAALRVLVVDDNQDAAEFVSLFLNDLGHETRIAYDGAAALAAALEFEPQVALLDIGLPGMDGYELAGHLRKVFGEGLFLVALTGWGQSEDRRRADEAGFDLHCTKPMEPARLEEILSGLGAKGTPSCLRRKAAPRTQDGAAPSETSPAEGNAAHPRFDNSVSGTH